MEANVKMPNFNPIHIIHMNIEWEVEDEVASLFLKWNKT